MLLAEAPVDALAEQVGVPVVAGVLLDHVDEQLAQRDRLTLGVVADEIEVVVAREPLGECDLLPPRRPRLVGHRRVGDRPVEVAVGVGLGLVALRHVALGEPAAEPAALHLGHVPDQAEQRHRGRFHGAAGQLLGVEPVALHLQRQPLAAQELIQRRPLVPQPRAAFARVGGGIEEQVGPVLWCGHADRDYWTAPEPQSEDSAEWVAEETVSMQCEPMRVRAGPLSARNGKATTTARATMPAVARGRPSGAEVRRRRLMRAPVADPPAPRANGAARAGAPRASSASTAFSREVVLAASSSASNSTRYVTRS